MIRRMTAQEGAEKVGERKLNLADVKDRALDDLLREIIHNRESVTVVVEEGQEVEIRPVGLKPLPELEGSIPAGWKDGIYAR